MRNQLALGMILALCICAGAVLAYPNFNATTGIIGTPTAYLAGPGTYDAAVDVAFFDDTLVNARLLYGFNDRLELGGLLVLGDDTGFGVNGKYQFFTNPGSFTWSAGATFIAANHDNNGYQVYVVGSRPVVANNVSGGSVVGSIGLNFTNFEGDNGVRPFIGAQVLMGANTEIAGEFMLKSGDIFRRSILSFVFRQRLSDRLRGEIGLTNANGFFGTEDHDLFLGASYAMGR